MNILMTVAPVPEYCPVNMNEKRPPLGMGILIALLRQNGHTVYFEDLYLHNEPVYSTPSFLARNKIDFAGIYTTSMTYPAALALIEQFDKTRREGGWTGKIMVGGPHTSFGSDDIPASVDHIVIGEGEKAILDIVEKSGEKRVYRSCFVEDLNTLPRPSWRDFIHLGYTWKAWELPAPVYTFNTSRGCPHSCSFCSVQGIWGRTYRYMSAERVLDDVGFMIEHYGLRSAYFREDHFTLNRERTMAFAEGLLKRGYNIRWACETRADSLDPEILDVMARSGCSVLYIGVESGSQHVLNLLNKGETVAQMENAILDARRCGIKTYASCIVAVPGETEEDLIEHRDFIRRVRPDFMYHSIYIGFPGSILYDQIKERGLCLYEEPVSKLRFLKGHNALVRRYYKGNPQYYCPVEDHQDDNRNIPALIAPLLWM